MKQLDKSLSLKCNKSALTKLEGDLVKLLVPKTELPVIEARIAEVRKMTEDLDKNIR